MEPFLTSDQYYFIRVQTQQLVNGHATINDTVVLKATTCRITKEDTPGCVTERIFKFSKLIILNIIDNSYK